MISAWNLLWIVPVCVVVGMFLAALSIAGGEEHDDEDE